MTQRCMLTRCMQCTMCHEAAAMEVAMRCDHELSQSLPSVWQPYMLKYVAAMLKAGFCFITA